MSLSIAPPATGDVPDRTVPACFHCGLPVPAGLDVRVAVDGRDRPMCCHGCAAVARAILDAGLGDYYRHRSGPAGTPGSAVPEVLREAGVYEHPEVQRGFVREAGEGRREASLILEGINCAACVWLIERRLLALPGVLDARVNYSTHRARVSWSVSRTRLSDILACIARIGYAAHPYDPERQEAVLERERKRQLKRIGIAGVLGMQVMMIAVVLYTGDWTGMEAAYRRFFEVVSLILAAPVVLYSARPFFAGAWRDLRSLRPGMDVPVALGIAIAFAGSAWATVRGAGQVYYDSVVMFVFLLLLARYLEFVARRRNAGIGEALAHPLPAVATRVDGGTGETVAVAALRAGDRVLVRPGEVVPADGRLLEGRSTVDEALLTGESRPVPKAPGDGLSAGSINVESPLEFRVEATGAETVFARILDLGLRAQAEKPRIAQLADGVAGIFVAAVLALAAASAVYWWYADPAVWLPVTLSVLVVTCPCALSLATPTALTAATSALAERGIIVTRGRAIEMLARARRFVFDKTGTLTHGRLSLASRRVLDGAGEGGGAHWLAVAAALERGSEHPIARALARAAGADVPRASDLVNTPGAGLRGRVEGEEYFLGTPEFISEMTGLRPEGASAGRLAATAGTLVLLAGAGALRCAFFFDDEPRPDAAELVGALRAQGVAVSLLSGDRPEVARRVGGAVGIGDVHAGLRPEEKLERLREMGAAGEVVAMVGDGVNDVPVLAGAQVSIAMGDGARIAQASADMILLGARLPELAHGVRVARRTLAVIRQNLVWAVIYNLVAVPAAAAGWVAPWMAAVGMSASSLLVVANSLRVRRAMPEPVRKARRRGSGTR